MTITCTRASGDDGESTAREIEAIEAAGRIPAYIRRAGRDVEIVSFATQGEFDAAETAFWVEIARECGYEITVEEN